MIVKHDTSILNSSYLSGGRIHKPHGIAKPIRPNEIFKSQFDTKRTIKF